MADASPAAVEHANQLENEQVTVPAEPAAAQVEDLDDLVEDVSVDGMCGVY